MNTIYLVRHGKTYNNDVKRLSGWVDSPLLPSGLEPTMRVAAKLAGVSFAGVYSSDMGRSFITAYELCAALGLEHRIIRVPGLREVNYGDAGNMLTAEAYKLYPGIDSETNFRPPNGETLAEMQARTIAAMAEIDAQFTDRNILVVAHSGTMAALDAAYRKVDFGGHNISEGYDHDAVALVTMQEGHVASFGLIA